MDFNFYQKKAFDTAIYPNRRYNYIYPALGLGNEAGEVLGKIKKLERGDYGDIRESDLVYNEFRIMLEGELGDVLWYLAVLAEEFDIDLDDVAQANLDKLAKRKEDNKLMGDGDNR